MIISFAFQKESKPVINDKLRTNSEEKLNENKADLHNIAVRDYRSLRRHHIGLDVQNSNIENMQDLEMSDHKLKRELGGVEHYTAAAAAAAAAGMMHHHLHPGLEHVRSNSGVDMEVSKNVVYSLLHII